MSFLYTREKRKEKEMFTKIMFNRITWLSITACVALLFCSLPKALSLEELDEYSAGCDECCNQTGGANCDNDGYGSCDDEPLDCGKVWCDPSYDNLGTICSESTHQWAPEGTDDADCDNGYLNPGQDECSILEETIFCSSYKKVDCDTTYDTIYHTPPQPNERIWYCDEIDEKDITPNNNSRLQCTGDVCWW